MITEDYVSFETAKLLKEMGFDEKCHMCWDEVTKIIESADATNSELLATYISAPTLQMAMKWLTEAYNIFISPQIEVSRNEKETGIHQYGQPGYYVIITYVLNGNILPYQGSLYPTPEQACEIAIKYCLENLILKL